GEAGKGFAVVAQEVRNLATRSAQSAKESTELIEGASQKVIKGSEIANKTSEALRDIVTSIEKVTNLVADISVSSQEQAQGVEQVSKGINQIEQVTQQNTASVEEVASSAEELSSQAVQLSSAIDFFQIGEAVLKTVHEEINNNMPNKLLTIC
ncbi:MAG: chemotaxis protein, partial [Desulfobacterales bacterium]|nr:chemotaxis protein [Desulfobacterales bacterium]